MHTMFFYYSGHSKPFDFVIKKMYSCIIVFVHTMKVQCCFKGFIGCYIYFYMLFELKSGGQCVHNHPIVKFVFVCLFKSY